MRTCASACVLLSLFAVLVLSIFATLLLNLSKSFEIPTGQKIRAGQSCVIGAVLYVFSGVGSAIYLYMTRSSENHYMCSDYFVLYRFICQKVHRLKVPVNVFECPHQILPF